MPINNSNVDSAQLKLILDYFDAVETNNVVKFLSILSENFQHHLLPKSFTLPGSTYNNPGSRAEFLDFVKSLSQSLKDFKFIVDEVVEQPGKLALHATSTAESFAGKPYRNEYMIIFHISSNPSDGKLKITLVSEMVDSLFTVNFFAELQKELIDGELKA